MEALLHIFSLVSATAVSAFVSAAWEGTALAACVYLVMRTMPRLSAASRSLIWMNVFLLLVLLHFVPVLVGRQIAGGMAQEPAIHLESRWSLAIAGAWAVLSLWRAVQLMLSAVRLHRLASRASVVDPDGAVKALLEGSDGAGRGGRAAELCTSNEVERPSVFGFFRPRILLPPALLERLSAQELQQVVVHEMEHLRRGDDWTNLLQKLGLVLFPLNPALLWVERRLCAERELACDDRVLRSNGARKAYAICLTHLAEYSMIRSSLSLVLGAWERQSELVRRVHRLLRRPHETMTARQTALVTGSLIAGVLGGAIFLARSPQLVSFAPRAQSAVQARATQPASLHEVNFRQSEGVPVLVKAVMPERTISTRPAAKPARSIAAKQNMKRRTMQAQQQWVVLTDWSDTDAPPQVVFAVDRMNRKAYAAVQMANGWLIVQI